MLDFQYWPKIRQDNDKKQRHHTHQLGIATTLLTKQSTTLPTVFVFRALRSTALRIFPNTESVSRATVGPVANRLPKIFMQYSIVVSSIDGATLRHNLTTAAVTTSSERKDEDAAFFDAVVASDDVPFEVNEVGRGSFAAARATP